MVAEMIGCHCSAVDSSIRVNGSVIIGSSSPSEFIEHLSRRGGPVGQEGFGDAQATFFFYLAKKVSKFWWGWEVLILFDGHDGRHASHWIESFDDVDHQPFRS